MTDPADIQPVVEVQPLDWNAYDVPRIWDAVRREDDFLAWEQVKGFENLARLLLSQHQRLRALRETLVTAWDPDRHPAAAAHLALLDDLLRSLERDALAHHSTSRALHAILTTLKAAKERIATLKLEWDNITTDWVPRWWNSQADDLNRRARHVIRQAEEAIADHRRRLLAAPAYEPIATSEPLRDTISGHRPQRTIAPPPPIPGHATVPAVPGSPVSLLPVPPGNPYAPGGGAYVLPGPGVGRGGWIYPRPDTAQAAPDGDAKPAGHLVWDATQGVPPIATDFVQASGVPDDDFDDWFADLAMPWTLTPR